MVGISHILNYHLRDASELKQVVIVAPSSKCLSFSPLDTNSYQTIID